MLQACRQEVLLRVRSIYMFSLLSPLACPASVSKMSTVSSLHQCDHVGVLSHGTPVVMHVMSHHITFVRAPRISTLKLGCFIC